MLRTAHGVADVVGHDVDVNVMSTSTMGLMTVRIDCERRPWERHDR